MTGPQSSPTLILYADLDRTALFMYSLGTLSLGFNLIYISRCGAGTGAVRLGELRRRLAFRSPHGVVARRRDCAKHEARLPAREHKA
jgi:hypothetical protein